MWPRHKSFIRFRISKYFFPILWVVFTSLMVSFAMPSSRGSSQPRDQTCISYVSCISRWVLYHWCHLGSPRWCPLTHKMFFISQSPICIFLLRLVLLVSSEKLLPKPWSWIYSPRVCSSRVRVFSLTFRSLICLAYTLCMMLGVGGLPVMLLGVHVHLSQHCLWKRLLSLHGLPWNPARYMAINGRVYFWTLHFIPRILSLCFTF